MGPFDVLEAWQSVTGRTLCAAHRDEFLRRPEVMDLTRYRRRDLYKAGRAARVVEAHGTALRLETWLEILRGTARDRPATSGGRLTSPEEILAPDLLGRFAPAVSRTAILRDPRLPTVMQYSRAAIKRVCDALPETPDPKGIVRKVLILLTALEKRNALYNYSPLSGRPSWYEHRPSDVGDAASKRI